ncbi:MULTISPECIES: ABC transporter ATP-binding protein [unclassified Mesorhizobium]|uniref:ABC transporter ATP-binding protein n=1 Tax=unclassified Mesorhizobium TaxID=325217 RepID=UPI000FCC3346|nr:MULTISPECIES: ABC transporter ATP-binding protein [unclassified Mesorhizobium]RUW34872.1 ABC transporter ATP-binding protein [Mesorhizobium sp. M1E.F.Ca.ET.041.01.1.1]RWD90834.1 MAG: ABC transporter ATP-binding protein [Mesorhizobium sp.]RWD92215.1 MAG: ABC transporter ATP-binding protein [Mesorhizobium sp.]TIV50935.1 MAG: ATP-binding cassette domain-containing protein [Mesorhizobium sp.]
MVAAVAAAAQNDRGLRAAIDFHGVSHRYELEGQALPVLHDVNLAVNPGEFVALVGPSGCGKSTLLRLAAGLDQPSRGAVLTQGAPVQKPDPSRVLVFQDPTLFPWRTVRDNVALGPQAQGTLAASSARIDDALKLVKLEGFAGAYPHQLSGGMGQRAALARALVNNPRVLLLDEPLGRLDSLTRLSMQQELLSLWRQAGYAVILVTHDVEEALLLSQRVVVLSERPASIKAVVEVDLPYPRHRDDSRIVKLRQQVLETLGFGG